MNAHDDQPPGELERDVQIDKPGIVGARWWHKSLVAEGQAVARRSVLKGLVVAGGVMTAIAVMGFGISKLGSSGDSNSFTTRPSLDMQKRYGWDFGARGEPLVFNGVSEAPFVREELQFLGAVMTPEHGARYYVPTLVESLFATPTEPVTLSSDGAPAQTGPARKLADVVVPVVTPAMERAYRIGESVARLAGGRGIALLVDLPGPEAVAFAAGAATRFEPILLFDNWPHPRAVVPSHLALAALAYYQPRFATQKARVSFDPMFVLDSGRLNPYSEEGDRFDNRYYARVPKLSALGKDGIKELLYIVPSGEGLPEPADLNGILGTPEEGAIAARALALSDFELDPAAGESTVYRYGGSAETEDSFSGNYALDSGATPASGQRVASSTIHRYQFTPRNPQTHTPPEGFGHVGVIVASSGLLVAAALDRRGSRNRFSGSGG